MRSLLPVFLASALLVGCNNVGGPYPSLQPRTAEGIDPRLPVAPLSAPAAVSPALGGRLAELVRQAQLGDAAFRPAIAQAERLAAAAGGRQSESWILAQQALSAAMAARAPTTRALGDVDEIAARQVQQRGTIAPADLLAVEQAAATISDIAGHQQQRIESAAGRIGG
jgi:hypothetical protein